ncbi:lipopolysaccharide biosynthesis protein, partial [Terribacillus saccharophilus]|uniref:lipopolysaccharide biosynthesis protein n=1 Tax=Terribacillus saccharophilus TaxID=361277 RepID=UPI002DCCE7B3|nr:oligosaccharide flippase family protein [Terribacillus saccharophilus]
VNIWGVIIEKKYWFSKGGQKLEVKKKELLSFGYPFIFTGALMWVLQSADQMIIRYYWDYHEVGIYSGALNIVKLLNIFQSVFIISWVPIVYQYYKNNPNDREFYVKANRIVSFIMLTLATMLIVLKDIIIFFLGEEYQGAVYVFPFLLLMPIMYTISETTVIGINFAKKTYYHIIISGTVAVINVIGNFILVPKLGAEGAAISTGLSYFLFFMLRTKFSNLVFKVNYKLGSFFISIILLYVYCFYATNSNSQV